MSRTSWPAISRGGQKKLLELGRTMMVDAKVVLLDEVAAGVNRTLLQDLAANIERMNRELGYTFFVIEHDMDLIGRLCDPVIVMAQGEKIAEGPMAEIRANPAIVEAYFGSPVAGVPRCRSSKSKTSSAAMAARRSSTASTSPSSSPISASSSGRTAPASRRRSRRSSGCSGSPSGTVVFDGKEITNALPDKLVPLGLSFVPQEKNVFTSMTVEENLEMGAFIRRDDFSDTLERSLRHVPGAQGKAPAAGGRAVGRPAPDGGDGPRADEQAAAC